MKYIMNIVFIASFAVLGFTFGDDHNNKWMDSYDYIIVGGGSAGCIVANRLSEDPLTQVLLLEAGEEDNDPLFPVPRTFSSFASDPKYNWGYSFEPQAYALNRTIGFVQGRVLGGTSSLWAGIVTRGSRHDYDRWAEMGNVGWSYDEVLHYFKKAENMLDPDLAQDDHHHGTGGPFSVRTVHKLPLGDVFVKAGQELGYSLTDYNGEEQLGFSYAQSAIDSRGNRVTSSFAYLKNIQGRSNLKVVTGTTVTKIDISNAHAHGVQFSKNDITHTVGVKQEVIVSAGSLSTPKLLMLSGIGPKQHLNSLGIPVEQDLPVGRELQDQVRIALRFNVKAENLPLEQSSTFESLFEYIFTGKGIWTNWGLQGIAFFRTDKQPSSDKYPNIGLLFFSNLPSLSSDIVAYIRNGSKITPKLFQKFIRSESEERSFTIFVLLLHPKSRGSVMLRSADPIDKPVITMNYLNDSRDMDDFIDGIRLLQEIINTKAFIDAGTEALTPHPACGTHEFDSDQYWQCYVRNTLTTPHHFTSTCMMGWDPASHVVDPRLRVMGVSGLRVVDGSVMPQQVSGPSMSSIVMIAEKASDMIKADRIQIPTSTGAANIMNMHFFVWIVSVFLFMNS